MIAKAMETKQADERPIYRRAARLFANLNGWRWDPAFRFMPESLGKYGNDHKYQRPYWCDHALYFQKQVEGRRGWVNIAIAGQPYAGAKGNVRPELDELRRRGFC